MVTLYMEGFSTLKCITIAEFFYNIISYHIYTQVFTIWFNGKSKQMAIFMYILKLY